MKKLEEGLLHTDVYLEGLEPRLQKGDEKIQVLFSLLKQEIQRHNASIRRKVTRVRNMPTD